MKNIMLFVACSSLMSINKCNAMDKQKNKTSKQESSKSAQCTKQKEANCWQTMKLICYGLLYSTGAVSYKPVWAFAETKPIPLAKSTKECKS